MSRDSGHYTRATGRLSKAPYGIYADSKRVSHDASTIYTTGDQEDSSRQYPLGYITSNQRKLVSDFLGGICRQDSICIDDKARAIHNVATWRCQDSGVTVVCTIVQPHVTNAIVHIKGVSTRTVLSSKKDYVAVVGGQEPSVNSITASPQPQGALAVPFTDYMLARGVVSDSNVQWSNTVLSKTQPIFIVVADSMAYECVLTHTSCNIMSRHVPNDAIILAPNSKSESYTFRRLSLTHGKGSGPSITVHRSGTMQYQGGGMYVRSLTSNFRNCIDHIMESRYSHRFISSLGVVRELSSFMPEM